MDTLIEKLKMYETVEMTDDERYVLEREIQGLADDLLIDAKGCVWEAHEVLEDHGFIVFPIERDRFGWLVGGIETKKGVITYG